MYAALNTSQTDLVKGDLFEFYDPSVTDLCPGNATKLYAGTSIVWLGYQYERQALGHGEISRYIDERFATVNINLSNVDRSVSAWIGSVEDRLEGWRVLVRAVSKHVDDDSVVMGVFRCEPVDKVNNKLVQITAKQSLGSINTELPWGKESPKCPLVFKGVRCLGGIPLGSHSAAYQAATTCDKSKQQCAGYSNLPAFQGEWFNAVTANFKVSQRRGGAGGALLALFGSPNKRVTKQHSSQDASSIGTPTPIIMGAAQVEFVPLQTDDTGQYLAGQWMIGAGRLTKIQNVHTITSGWDNNFQAYAEHKGALGYDAEQIPAGYFASQDQRHSQKGYVEITIKGDNPDTGDPAPTIVGRIMGIKVPAWTGTTFGADAFSDNPVDHCRAILTDERSLKYNSAWIDEIESGKTADFCSEPLKDTTGGEDIYLSQNAGTPGTDYKRYRSSGVLDKYYWRYVMGLDADHSAVKEITYHTFNPAAAPISPTPSTVYRKRYTSNFVIRDTLPTIDFLYQYLLPAFRGYFITSAQGKLQIKARKPTISSFIRNNLSIGATAIPVEDALAWRSLNLPVIFALVGVGLSTSETREVTSIDFSTAGNSITLAATGSATASGATLAGGSSSAQAQGTITIGSIAAASVTIDGVIESYTPGTDDTTGTIAAMLATQINANATINRFAEALWTKTLPTQVIIRSKLGILNVAPLTYAHNQLETVAHVHMVFSDVAMGALSRGNILEDSFEWPFGGKVANYNKFVCSYQSAPDDYQLLEVDEIDEANIEKINKTNKKEIKGGCIDNYHQARRLVVAERYTYREGNYFVQIKTDDARCLLLEEGDFFCATHNNQPNQRNMMFTVEELKVSDGSGNNDLHTVTLLGRLYADDQFPLSADQRTISSTTGVGWPSNAPGPVTSLVLTSTQPFTVHGSFTFANFIGPQRARIEVERAGTTGFMDTGLSILPDASNNGSFDLSGLPAGLTSVRVTAISIASGAESSPVTGTVTVLDFDFEIDLNADGVTLEVVQEDDGSGPLVEG